MYAKLAAMLPSRRELVTAGVALAVAHGAIALTGGVSRSPLYPLVPLAIAVCAGLLGAGATAAAAIAACLLEVIAGARGAVLAAHVAFIALFALLFAALLRGEVIALRAGRAAAVDDALRRIEQDARDFRLLGSLLRKQGFDAEEAARRRRVSSVRAIRDALADMLEAARTAVRADGALLFTLDPTRSELRAKAAAPKREDTLIEAASSSEGVLGAVVRTERPVHFLAKEPGKGFSQLAHAKAQSLLAIPLFEDGDLFGVLAVHRDAAEPFEESDERLLDAFGREARRAIESERILVAMDRIRYEHERFYEAFALLNEALTVEAAADRLIEAVSRIRSVGFGAVTLYEAESDEHAIVRVKSAQHPGFEGRRYAAKKGGLVAMAVKNGQPLPYVPLSRQPDKLGHRLFDADLSPELRAVKVFPLLARGAPLGALVVGSTDAGAELTREEERMIETIAVHAANTLANARLYGRMETMATTDGLTGLTNRRRFHELLDEAMARAARFSRKLSVLMVDADHFKRVNDTYGHATGDVVLKRIASLLQAEARRTDVVGRLGGEEFCVLLDETDEAGARLVAERIRERIEREPIQGDSGRIHITVSAGLAVWSGRGAESKESLLERADRALYDAKKNGRNRVEVSSDPRCASESPASISAGGPTPPRALT